MNTKSASFLHGLTIDLFNSVDYDRVVDIQFSRILQRIEKHINNNEIEIVIDWLHESIKNEIKFKKKLNEFPYSKTKPVIRLLLSKSNALHENIVELFVNLIEKSMFNPQNQISGIFEISHKLISDLIDNIDVDEEIYASYIQLLSHAVENMEYF